jgi:hypothetical protein
LNKNETHLLVSDESDLSIASGDNIFEERPRGGDSPMEIKNYFPTPFVRHGFGRMSTTSSSYQGSDMNYNCVDEMSENEEKIITVKHCISKYNSTEPSEVTTTKEETRKEESSEFRKKEKIESKFLAFIFHYITLMPYFNE